MASLLPFAPGEHLVSTWRDPTNSLARMAAPRGSRSAKGSHDAKNQPNRIRKRAPRHTPDIDEIIAVTIELLARHGESGFRIEDLQKRTGVNKSSLYLRFGGRDGLLASAYSEIFKRHIEESLDGLRPILQRASTPAELRAGVHAATAFVMSPQRLDQRLERAAIIAGVRGRPEYRKALRLAQTTLTTAMDELFDTAAARGLINLKHPSRVAAQFIQGLTFGRIVAEIEDPDDQELRDDWIALSAELLDRMLFDGLLDA